MGTLHYNLTDAEIVATTGPKFGWIAIYAYQQHSYRIFNKILRFVNGFNSKKYSDDILEISKAIQSYNIPNNLKIKLIMCVLGLNEEIYKKSEKYFNELELQNGYIVSKK